MMAVMCCLHDSAAFLNASRTIATETYDRRFCRNKNEADHMSEKLLNDPSWLKTAVVRHPVEKFLAGYVDKCVNHRSQVLLKIISCLCWNELKLMF